MQNWLTYANQGATRSKPLSEDLTQAMGFLPELGVTMEVFSGGQAPKGSGGPRTGSTRHDHGNAADVFFYRDGRKLDWSNPDDVPIYQEIVRRGRQAGLTGFGAGKGYMQPGSMHIGFGNEAVWGAGGSGENAPGWLREAYSGAPAPSAAPSAPGRPQGAPAGSTGGSSDLLALIDQRSRPRSEAQAEPSRAEQMTERMGAMNALSQFMPQGQQQDVTNFLAQPEQPQQSVGFGPGTNPFLVG